MVISNVRRSGTKCRTSTGLDITFEAVACKYR